MTVGLLSAVGLVAVLLAVRLMFVVITVDGHSMEPQYRPGDRVVALRGRLLGRPVTGDVVLIRRPSGANGGSVLFLKNVVAAPGDPVPTLFAAITGDRAGRATPDGCYLVLGRHRASEDSKNWGYVSSRDIVGKALRPRRLGDDLPGRS
ncbi:S26 family signal peptidase [Kitasatospora sp. NBC_01287]|uniref:S26 family signal peptidase n=1 Tax=Kitasatospora sp. NBC_01287 TaxID=2903573 RepID=UPI00224F7345|nr:S26 family signal peptidase [Kitasatospora sp. NBC_01287]MCX4750516.1 S26 family signal peptidase [Kitasatospora sp. NBC_01287]